MFAAGLVPAIKLRLNAGIADFRKAFCLRVKKIIKNLFLPLI